MCGASLLQSRALSQASSTPNASSRPCESHMATSVRAPATPAGPASASSAETASCASASDPIRAQPRAPRRDTWTMLRVVEGHVGSNQVSRVIYGTIIGLALVVA